MELQIGPHLEESEVEQYSMGELPEASLAPFEEHLLACVSCQDRLLEMEAYVNAVCSVSPNLRAAPRPRWRELFFQPWPAWAAAMALGVIALTVVILRVAPPRSQVGLTAVFLQSSRGIEGLALARAPVGQPVLLNIDLTELPAFPSYRLEIVNAAGKPVWQAAAIPKEGKIAQPLSKGLAAGQYYIRLYGPGGELLREFSLRAG
jgi:hypothetical protein